MAKKKENIENGDIFEKKLEAGEKKAPGRIRSEKPEL